MTTATTETKAPTIQDAVNALFAEKEANAPKKEAVAAAPSEVADGVSEESSPNVGDAAGTSTEATAEAKTEEAKEAPKVEAKPSAVDAALQIAKLNKKLAAAQAQLSAVAPKPEQPNTELIEVAKKIKAAGGDPWKQFQASGLDLAAVVAAAEKEMLEPDFADPLMVTVKQLQAEINELKAAKQSTEATAIVTQFQSEVVKRAKANADRFDALIAMGDEGVGFVQDLIEVAAGELRKPISLDDAMEKANTHYATLAEKLSATKTVASKFKTQTKKPALSQQAPAAALASPAKTKPVNVRDVINDELDALMGD